MRLTREQQRLVEDNLDIAYVCARYYGYRVPDSVSESLLMLCYAACEWDGRYQFYKYARYRIRRGLHQIKRKADRWERGLRLHLATDFLGFDVPSLDRVVCDSHISHEKDIENKDTLKHIYANSTDKAIEFYDRILQGDRIVDIAKSLGISKQSVSLSVKRVAKEGRCTR